MKEYEKHSFRIENDSEYQKYLKEELNDYISWVRKNHNEYVDEVQSIVEHINDAVSSYYESNFISAIRNVKEVVDEDNLLSCDAGMGNKDYADALFKARVAESTENIKHEDMLHIPFDRRNIVSSQRFSLSGTPCIYLAKSSYTCWLELNKPEENKFFVSAFKLLNPKKFLDLTCLTWEDLETENGIKSDVKAKLCTFPLIIATSFLVNENIGRSFHSEYIISELLMNVIATSNKYDGIAYFSKKFSNKRKYYPINVCFALFAKFNSKKYTKDIEDFEWTEPMALREYSMFNWEERYSSIVLNCGGAETRETEKTEPFTLIAENVAYNDTIMYDFDKWLMKKMKFMAGKNSPL